MELKDIRRQNFQYLCDKIGRGPLAEKLGYKDTIYLNLLYGGHDDIGNRTAKKIEDALNLGVGWLSRMHDQSPIAERANELMKLLPASKQQEVIQWLEFQVSRVAQDEQAPALEERKAIGPKEN